MINLIDLLILVLLIGIGSGIAKLQHDVNELRALLQKPSATNQPAQSISIDDRLDRYVSQQRAASRQIFHPLPDEKPKHKAF